MKIVIPKIYTRDFPITLCQTWGKFYKNFPVKKKVFPSQVVVINKGLIHAYRYKDFNFMVNDILLEKVKKDKNYIENFFNDADKKISVLKKVAKEEIKTREEWIKVADFFESYWGPLVLPIFIPKDTRFSESDRNIAMHFREKTEKLEHFAFENYSNSLKNIYMNLGEFTKYLFLEEIKEGKIPSFTELQKRSQQTFYVVEDSIMGTDEFKKLEESKNFCLEEENHENVTEFKGDIACKGLVRGHVRLILYNEDVFKVKEGDILVTYMTVPTFLPAMKKASAFVTDEGGITCHAAIVARELKKPCIIGTKIATKVLKDGDEVEVDAEKGVVTIIKRV